MRALARRTSRRGTSRRGPARPALALTLGALLAGCRVVAPPGVVLATEPPGARVVVGGFDSGFVTPCNLDLDGGSLTEVRLELPGYVPAVRLLSSGTSYWYVPWHDGNVGVGTWRFPLWLSFQELLLPVEVDSGRRPRRIFVRLRPAEAG